MRHGPMGGGMAGNGLFFGVAGFIFTLLVIGLITALVLYLIKRGKRGPGPHDHHPGPGRPPFAPGLPPAMQLLDERLARGEIEVTDYLERKAAMLGEHPRPTEWTVTDAAPSVPAEVPEPPKDNPDS